MSTFGSVASVFSKNWNLKAAVPENESLNKHLFIHVYIQCSDVSRTHSKSDILALTFCHVLFGSPDFKKKRVWAHTFHGNMVGKEKGYSELTLNNKKTMFDILWLSCKHGEIERGKKVTVAWSFQVAPRTVSRVLG
jgi:hypothetical protein